MKIEIARGEDRQEVELSPGALSVGGAPEDTIRIDALPPSLVTVEEDQGRLVVVARQTLPVGGVLCPPEVRRLVLPGEAVELPDGITLREVPVVGAPRSDGTVAVLLGLMASSDAPASSRAAAVTCLTGLDLARVFLLADGANELGRGDGVAIRLRDRAVSRRHARLIWRAEGCDAEDLGSPNGVFVNGQRIHDRHALQDGDVLELGHTLLRYTAPTEVPVEPPVAPSPALESPPPEPPLEPPLPPRRRRIDGLLLAIGVGLALLGALLAWGLAVPR